MATRKLVPRADDEGGIGTVLLRWASGWIKLLIVSTINKLTITTPATGATLTIADGKTLTVTDSATLDEAVALSDKATQGVWTDYSTSSTIAGWQAGYTKRIWYKKIGKTVFCAFIIDGTSDASTAQFTLPFSAVNPGTFYFGGTLIQTRDNGVNLTTAGRVLVANGGNLVSCSSNAAGAGWTTSGNKVVSGSIWYETP